MKIDHTRSCAYKYEMEGLCVKHKFIWNETSEREKPAVSEIASQ